jgi:FkbM family methyltransferase
MIKVRNRLTLNPKIFSLPTKILNKMKQQILNPRLKVTSTNLILKSFGSAYGGWVVAISDSLKASTIISWGLGEDASFDIEMINEFNLRVVFVDPTPRAIEHFEQIINCLGSAKSMEYSVGGAQEIDAYELVNLSQSSFKLIPKAIWLDDNPVRFYSPPIEDHVSHSILNYQNSYSTDTPFIEVDAITIKQIMIMESLESIPLIKLDIEGAEIEVICSFLDRGIYPEQILVEFDELSAPSFKARGRIIACHEKLIENGYALVNYSRPSNFLYLLTKSFGL